MDRKGLFYCKGVIIFISLILIPFVFKGYYLYIINLILIYSIVTLGYNLVLGYTGLMNFGQHAFFGLGAYISVLLNLRYGISFWLTMPLSSIITVVIVCLISLPTLRLSGMYLGITTYAFSVFAGWVFLHWSSVTGGAFGLNANPPRVGTFRFDTDEKLYFLIMTIFLVMLYLIVNIIKSRFGRAFKALRDSEPAAESLGINLARYKIISTGIGAFYAAIGGALFSVTVRFLHPESFDTQQLIRQFSMLVVGGLGSIRGSILGSITLTVLPEVFRGIKSLQEVAYGLCVMLVLLFMPKGIDGLVRSIEGRRTNKRKS